MLTRRLPNTDLDLSVIGMGCWAMGGPACERVSAAGLLLSAGSPGAPACGDTRGDTGSCADSATEPTAQRPRC